MGAILLGEKGGMAPISRLIAEGVDVAAHSGRLFDYDVDLKTLL